MYGILSDHLISIKMQKKKSFYFGKNFARSQFSYLTNTPKKRRQAGYRLKSLEFADLCEATDYLDRNLNHKIKESIFGKPLPESFAELANTDYSIRAENIVNELNWTLIGIRKHVYQINLFLLYKEQYENAVIKAEYEDAERFLIKIENEICYSLWGLENRFLLNELKHSSLANKELLTDFNSTFAGPSVIKSLAHWLSIRAEQSLSVKRYVTDLENALTKIDPDAFERNRDYYLFKLSFINNYEYRHFSDILNWDFRQSILDRYISFRKVLISILTTVTDSQYENEAPKLVKEYILNRINYLIRKLNDPILYKLKLFGDHKLFPAFEIETSKTQIDIQDKFTLGAYAEAEAGAKELLTRKPTQFDIYLIYVESLIYQNKAFQPVGKNSSLQNQILLEVYTILSGTKDPQEAAFNLLRLSNNLASNPISYGIIDFVLLRTKGDIKRKMLAGLSYNMANPSVHECFRESDDQKKYLDFLSEKFPNSITITFLRKKAYNIDSIEEFKHILPRARYLTELAKGHQIKNEIEQAILTWQTIIIEFKDTMPLLEIAVQNLYDCYFSINLYDDCIKLYVDNYITNQFIVDKINPKPLLSMIRKNRFKVVKAAIEVPIFYSLVQADENETHIAFEKFNLSQNILTPTKLCTTETSLDFIKLILYLRITCTTEILKHSIHINGSKERLEERLYICEFLKQNDSVNIFDYEDEIKAITNTLIIQQGRIELDESKIYVNESGIIQSELRDFEAIYNRFTTIAGISKKKLNVFVIEGGKFTTLNIEEDETEQKKIKYSTNPVYDIYLELFEAVKDKFLYSKFGIVAYLSTRIRHGVLLGEIRPIFEKHRLITRKDGSSLEYRPNEYWNNHLANEFAITQSKIQDLLREFSSCIDGLIFDLIKKHLQVKDEVKNPDGWFNYNFTDDELFWHSVTSAAQVSDFNSFVKRIFEILWLKTDENLKSIRDKIQTTVADGFNQLFTDLEKDISTILSKQSALELTTGIKACSTEVQATVMRISNWFKRSGTQLVNFKLGDLIDVVVGYTDKYNRLKITKDIDFKQLVKGEFYSHVADLLRIFIENILKHSDNQAGDIEVTISTKTDNNVLHLSISNYITDLEKVEHLRTVSNHKKMDLDQLLSENKSGYHKAYKILTSDLKNESNRFGTNVIDEHNLFQVHTFIDYTELIA